MIIQNKELRYKKTGTMTVSVDFYKIKRNNKSAYFMKPVFIRGVLANLLRGGNK